MFDLQVAITCLTEGMKKPTSEVIGMPMMGGVNLQQIEVPTFDANILNWQPFWEQSEDTVYDKSHLGDVDKLTYLRDVFKGGPAMYMYVIQGLT